jgi:uncharacterized pyridoxamine 5'-phosphate oxidase family protein
MTKKEILEAITKNPVFFLATIDGDQPRTRGMLLYKADENGIVFHTGKSRDLYKQLVINNKAELCFNCDGAQIRISGRLEEIDDNDFKDEITAHPTRIFLKPLKDSMTPEQFHNYFVVYSLKNGIATIWTMEKNLDPKEIVQL